ncbi:lipase 3-like [Anoplolepis gracilipes]|uniref:lipase 3-like n=1 Tax=Anoplolepis gracilipes TaxID=354296 RepID=UPI003B9EBC37
MANFRRIFSQLFKLFVDMRLIAIIRLLSFCSYLDKALADVTSGSSELEGITWPNWEQSNKEKFNLNVFLNTSEMIRRAGYPAESHVVTTKDGYLLTLHRIPGGNGSAPVLLQHGLLSSSADWLVLGKGKALAYLLADQGYDVWLGNFRGNTYSKAHISLSSLELRFWNFSFNEMGIYDLPAMITFITNMRSQPLHTYIGHSMGTTSFYIMASECPEIARRVKMMISLGPGAYINNMKSPLKYIWGEFETMQLFFRGEFMPHSDIWRSFSKYNQNLFTQKILVDIMFLLVGYDYEQFDYTLLPVILNHDPAGSSVKTVTHYAQGINSGKFRHYDYGQEKNLLIYNSSEPPDYDLTKIMVPIALYYSVNDWIFDIKDVQRLYRLLPNVVDQYEVPWPKFNHVDFIWAKDAPTLLYERILNLMKGKNVNNITSI